MALVVRDVEARVGRAIAHYWQTLDAQSSKQTAGSADRGRRAAVTGGQQMRGFANLVRELLKDNGIDDALIRTEGRLDLPGYFRPTKAWDLLVIHRGQLLAAIEFKSQRGPSFGNNFNNRSEEAIGTAVDLWTAFREEAFGRGHPRPFLGWVMLLEHCPESLRAVEVSTPFFAALPVFENASYAARYQILLRRMLLEKLYDSAAFVMATAEGGARGEFTEPASDLTMQSLLASLVGQIAARVAAVGPRPRSSRSRRCLRSQRVCTPTGSDRRVSGTDSY